jgi:hypothetical protein
MNHFELAIRLQAINPGNAAAPDLAANRQAFWRGYLVWQALASDGDLAKLARALEPHAQHVRPIHAAIGDALQDPNTVVLLPMDLLVSLFNTGWTVERSAALRVPLPHAA